MALSDYLSGWSGIGHISNYLFAFILTINPAIFRLFRPRNYILFFIGALISLINYRAMLPFYLLIIIDLDYSKLDADYLKTIARFAFLTFFFYAIAKSVS